MALYDDIIVSDVAKLPGDLFVQYIPSIEE